MILEPEEEDTTKKQSLLSLAESVASAMAELKASEKEILEVNRSIQEALAQLTDSIGTLNKRGKASIDTAPLARLMQQANQQNQDLIAAVTRILEKTSSSDQGRLIREVVTAIEKSNKTMMAFAAQTEKTIQTLVDAIVSRPTAWKHEIKRRGGQLDHIVSTPEKV